MKFLIQFAIIAAVSAVGELLHIVLPFPVPASVYGLVLLFVLLMTKAVRPAQIEETADFLLHIMPVLFMEPAVKLMTAIPILQGQALKLFFLCILSTCVTIAVTGVVSQAVIRLRKKKTGKTTEEGLRDE